MAKENNMTNEEKKLEKTAKKEAAKLAKEIKAQEAAEKAEVAAEQYSLDLNNANTEAEALKLIASNGKWAKLLVACLVIAAVCLTIYIFVQAVIALIVLVLSILSLCGVYRA